MKKTFCTIITSNYVHYALTLNYSLLKYSPDAKLKILISDSDINLNNLNIEYPNVELFYIHELCGSGIGKKIKDKYHETDMDCFRWSMKPVFISYLLNQDFDEVVYLDSDLYFFSEYDFLYKELENHDVILTPHWRAIDPHLDEANFSTLQTSGLYNAGFIGVTKKAMPAMEWWSEVCEFKCQKAPEKGLFVDQAYLDLMHVYFDGVHVIKHKGCNVANWNQVECRRTISRDGVVKINNKREIVFIHFTKSTIEGIRNGQDYLLASHLDEYVSTLEKFRIRYNDKFTRKRIPLVKAEKINKASTLNEINNTDDFLSPAYTSENSDLYLVRSSILRSLKKYLPRLSGTVLDVGCGKMPYKPLLLAPETRIENYIGLDFVNNTIHKNNPDITWKEGKIPLDTESIDCAICTEVLEHCHDPENVLREIYRVLKPAGLLFFTVPFIWPLHEVPYDEYRYTPFAIDRHLKNTGFKDVKIDAQGGWNASLAQMLGLWVRRSPMGKRKRAVLSRLIFPVYKYLIKKDKRPTEFTEQTMLTGMSGICVK